MQKAAYTWYGITQNHNSIRVHTPKTWVKIRLFHGVFNTLLLYNVSHSHYKWVIPCQVYATLCMPVSNFTQTHSMGREGDMRHDQVQKATTQRSAVMETPLDIIVPLSLDALFLMPCILCTSSTLTIKAPS